MGWTVRRWKHRSDLEQCFGGRGDAPRSPVVTLRQVHGRVVHHVDEMKSGVTEGDALVTDRRGSTIGIWTADCVPVHLVPRSGKIVAAAHCGWRGAAAGVVPATLGVLRDRWGVEPPDVEVALGPSIGGCCYEVGREVYDALEARAGEGARSAFEPRGDRLHLDLRSFIAAELAALGVREIERVGPCTACRPDMLHSYRKQRDSGRQLSWIGIPNEP